MSEREDFLARWSRRKHQAAEHAEKAPIAAEPDAPEQQAERDDSLDIENPFQATEPLFDPATLPAIESISAETDIRAFLSPGVPAELTRAALRRVWTTDPKIRDFIGLADYAWDFHAPNGMAGFGPLEMTDELRRGIMAMLSRNQPREDLPASASSEVENIEQIHGECGLGETGSGYEVESAKALDRGEEATSIHDMKVNSGNDVAAQYPATGNDQSQAPPPHRHGSALPKPKLPGCS
jgi:uncharacterized protein DUF3306